MVVVVLVGQGGKKQRLGKQNIKAHETSLKTTGGGED